MEVSFYCLRNHRKLSTRDPINLSRLFRGVFTISVEVFCASCQSHLLAFFRFESFLVGPMPLIFLVLFCCSLPLIALSAFICLIAPLYFFRGATFIFHNLIFPSQSSSTPSSSLSSNDSFLPLIFLPPEKFPLSRVVFLLDLET